MVSGNLALTIFLDASTHLYKRVYPSVCWSVRLAFFFKSRILKNLTSEKSNKPENLTNLRNLSATLSQSLTSDAYCSNELVQFFQIVSRAAAPKGHCPVECRGYFLHTSLHYIHQPVHSSACPSIQSQTHHYGPESLGQRAWDQGSGPRGPTMRSRVEGQKPGGLAQEAQNRRHRSGGLGLSARTKGPEPVSLSLVHDPNSSAQNARDIWPSINPKVAPLNVSVHLIENSESNSHFARPRDTVIIII